MVSKDGVSGRTPVMGWNSWNAYRCDINETRVLDAAKELITYGLKELGYVYVNIDDCWSIPNTRDPETLAIIPDPAKFPHGIKWLADQIHALGLKLGIYGDAGETTCAGFPGSLYFEEIDARTWAEWGVDYLKYDNCNVPSSWPSDPYHNCHPDYNSPHGPNATCINDPLLAPPGYDWSTSPTAERFMRMSEALDKQNRTILLSLCEWGQAGVAEGWGEEVSISWRLTDDIFPRWPVIKHIANYASFFSHSVAFFAHNDLDMLEIGNGNLTLAEQRTHFSLWAALKSPLLIGTDISALSPAALAILKNHALIAFNQDPKIAAPAQPFNWNWEYNDDLPAAYWSGRGQEGVMVLLVNWHEKEWGMGVSWGEVPELVQGKGYKVKNGWTGEELGCWKGWEGMVEKHDTVVLVVGEECEGLAKSMPLFATLPASNSRISSKKLEYLKEMAAKEGPAPGVVGDVKAYRQEDVQVVDAGDTMELKEDSE
ncbi:glycoside hydrolase [Ascodesmis nigricans]|uniref:Alpha-galactosidase n=1 Tax=Ascodesmis nigricans TaxID=341454 RepID=A0A4V3SIQ2_9PEZI|nr:glycoside hydrolase [Ascodesmis nigricans]